MASPSFCFVILLTVLSIAYAEADETPFFVVLMANMGARFPTVIPGSWVKSSGGLTSVGMRQMYILGREMRKQYIEDTDLLDEQYNSNQLLLRASSFNRTTTCMSAYSFARGLYVPGSGFALLNKEQIARAVPPSTFVNYSDYQKELRDAASANYFAAVPVMLYSGGPDYSLVAAIYCENLNKLVNDYLKSNSKLNDEVEKRKKMYEPAFKEISTVFKTKVTEMGHALVYRDYVVSARFYAQDIPEKLSNATLDLLDDMFSFFDFNLYYADITVARAMSHYVLKEIRDNLNNSLSMDSEENKMSRRSMMAYVMHEGNIFAFMRMMNYLPSKPILCPFASALIFEVYKTGNEKRVRVKYNGEILKWNNTEESIEVGEFMKWLQTNMLKDFDSVCHGASGDSGNETPWIVVSVVIGVALLVMLALTCYFICKKDKGEEETTKKQGDEEKAGHQSALEYPTNA